MDSTQSGQEATAVAEARPDAGSEVDHVDGPLLEAVLGDQVVTDAPQPVDGDAAKASTDVAPEETDLGADLEAAADVPSVTDSGFDNEADEKLFGEEVASVPDYGAGSDWFDGSAPSDCPYQATGGGTAPTVFCNDQECCISGVTNGPCGWTKCCGDAAIVSKWVPGDYCKDVMEPKPPGILLYGPCPAILKYEKDSPPLPACNPQCWCY